MKKLLLTIIFTIFCSSLFASEIIDLAGEIRIPVPEHWQVTSESGKFPFQIINADQSAELLIFKSLIDKNEKVKNNDELKTSVDFIINDIIMVLPEAKLLSSTGKIDENRAIFSLEFISTDTATTGIIHQRLNGYLYGHPDGYQILFTLWSKANSANKEILQNEIFFMQNNFAYYGDSHKTFLQVEENVDWKIYFLILLIIVTTLFIFKRYNSSNKINFSDDSHFWRCSCGRQNHLNNESCKRCGQKKAIKAMV